MHAGCRFGAPRYMVDNLQPRAREGLYLEHMNSTLAWVGGLVVVAAVSFFAGVAYVASGNLVPQALQFLAPEKFVTAEVVGTDTLSITLRLQDGTTAQMSVSAAAQIGYAPLPVPVPLGDVPVGATVNVYASDGVATQVHILAPAPS